MLLFEGENVAVIETWGRKIASSIASFIARKKEICAHQK
jgi:hypothetical protein